MVEEPVVTVVGKWLLVEEFIEADDVVPPPAPPVPVDVVHPVPMAAPEARTAHAHAMRRRVRVIADAPINSRANPIFGLVERS